MKRTLVFLLSLFLLLTFLPVRAHTGASIAIQEAAEASAQDVDTEVMVRLSDDLRTASVSGNAPGLFARAALLLENNGVTGLFTTQADISPEGIILIPQLEIDGLLVTGVNVALVRELEDISSVTPHAVASDFRIAEVTASTPPPVPVSTPGGDPAPTPAPVPESTPGSPPVSRSEQLLSEMSLWEKVCQMMIVRPTDLEPRTIRTVEPEMKDALERFPVGGLFYNTVNMTSQSQVRELIADTQAFSAIPLLIMCDEEGGTVSRLMRTVGTTWVGPMLGYRDEGPAAARENAKTIGGDMAALGFNLDLAPVADVWSNPANTVIGTRAYSDDFSQAAVLVSAAVEGFHAGGVACTLKHFPGHGDTSEDSHYGSAYVYKSLEDLRTQEFLPFQAGIDAGADAVMIGHIIVTDISDEPALFSYTLVTDILRGELGFEGVIVTDSLEMQAISNNYGTAEIAVRAVKAGVDMLLCPRDPETAVNALVSAVETGEISESRIDESVLRILTLKENREIL